MEDERELGAGWGIREVEKNGGIRRNVNGEAEYCNEGIWPIMGTEWMI